MVKTEETGTLLLKAQLRDLGREPGRLEWLRLQSCLSRIEPFPLERRSRTPLPPIGFRGSAHNRALPVAFPAPTVLAAPPDAEPWRTRITSGWNSTTTSRDWATVDGALSVSRCLGSLAGGEK